MARGLGRGRGSTSAPVVGAGDLVVWLAGHARRGHRPYGLALPAFAVGLPVPEPTVRAALRAIVDRVHLPGEASARPAGQDRADWAFTVAEQAVTRGAGVLLPRRMRHIDARITAAGGTFAPAELATHDRGPAIGEPVTGRDLATFAAAAVLAGGAELAGPALAPHVRALLPPGAASPVASWLEYPDGPGRDPSEIHDGAGLRLLPDGDARADLLRTIGVATLAQLRTAWHAALAAATAPLDAQAAEALYTAADQLRAAGSARD